MELFTVVSENLEMVGFIFYYFFIIQEKHGISPIPWQFINTEGMDSIYANVSR